MRKIAWVSILSLAASSQVFGYGVGVSTSPLELQKKLLQAEFTGAMSNGSGVGFQARYTQKIMPNASVDGGLGLGTGDRVGRAFVGMDWEMFPEYSYQPRISLKPNFERSKEFDTWRNVLGVTPTVAKTINVQGKEIEPFMGLPMGINLNGSNQTYQGQMALALGATGRLPIEGYQKILANVELDANIKNSFTAAFVGVSYPLD